MDAMQQSQQNIEKLASREKYWEECSDAEKIERLRQSLADAHTHLSRMRETISILQRHQHGSKGELLIDPFARNVDEEPRRHWQEVPHSLRTERERR